jgi:hypothetical protein
MKNLSVFERKIEMKRRFSFDRRDFDIGTKHPNAALSNEIKLTIEVDAVKQ